MQVIFGACSRHSSFEPEGRPFASALQVVVPARIAWTVFQNEQEISKIHARHIFLITKSHETSFYGKNPSASQCTTHS